MRRTLTGDLGRVIAVCLEKDPHLRYPSAGALADDIERYLRGEPMLARGPGIGYRVGKKVRRYRGPVAALGAAAAACGVLVWTLLRPSHAPLNFAPLTTYQGSEISPSFSPDGNEVRGVRVNEEDNWDIYRVRIGEAAPRRLTSDPVTERSPPAWSRDGKTISVSAGRGRERSAVDGNAGGGRRVTRAGEPESERRPAKTLSGLVSGQPLSIGDASRSAAQRQRIFAISATTGEQRQLTGLDKASSSSDGQPTHAQNGLTLFFGRDAVTPGQSFGCCRLRATCAEQGGAAPPRSRFRRCTRTGRATPISKRVCSPLQRGSNELMRGSSGKEALRNLSEMGGNVREPEISRWQKGWCSSGNSTTPMCGVWIWMLRQGGRRTAIAWSRRRCGIRMRLSSADGKRLVFESNRSGFYELLQAGADGSDSRQITSYHSITSGPQWSPDGGRIVFSALKDGCAQIFTMAAGGGPFQQMTFAGEGAMLPLYAPDGKWIYFSLVQSGARQIWRVPAQGGTPQQMTHDGGNDAAFHRMDVGCITAGCERSARRSGGCLRVAARRTRWSIARWGGMCSWRSSGCTMRGELRDQHCRPEALDLVTGETKVLATTDHEVRDRIAVSRDERTIYYTQADQDGVDLMLVSDFHQVFDRLELFLT